MDKVFLYLYSLALRAQSSVILMFQVSGGRKLPILMPHYFGLNVPAPAGQEYT